MNAVVQKRVCVKNRAPVGILPIIKNNSVSLVQPQLTQSTRPPATASPISPLSHHSPVIDSDREMREVQDLRA